MDQEFFSKLYEDSPIELATIQRVHRSVVTDPTTQKPIQVPYYSCEVVTQDGRKFENIPWISPYVNPDTGAGLYVVPKQLTRVLIAYAKKGQPYIIGWLTPVSRDGRYTGNREDMPEGSVAIKGDFGNKILLKHGGVIEIASTPTCRRRYINVNDQIRDFCRNYFLTTAGGTYTWLESRDGKRTTAIRIEAFEKAGGKDSGGKSVRVQYGTHSEDFGDPEPSVPAGKIFSTVVGENTKVYIGPNGRIIVKNEHPAGGDNNDISIDSDGKFTLNNMKAVEINTDTGAITLQAGSSGNTVIQMAANGAISVKAPSVTIQATGMVTLDAPIVRTTDQTFLADGFLPAVRMLDPVLVFDPEVGYINGQVFSTSVKVFVG